MERIMVVPLRKARRGSRSKFAPKAVRYLREFIARHMKAREVIVGNELNKFIWSRGIKNPPRRVEVRALKKGEIAYVEIATIGEKDWKKFIGEEVEKKKEEKKVEEKKVSEEEAKEVLEELVKEERGEKKERKEKEKKKRKRKVKRKKGEKS